MVITHPFHPLLGQRLRVLGGRWHGGRLTLFCDAGGVRMALPQEWTDRGPAPVEAAVSVESLGALAALVDLLACRDADRRQTGGA